MHVYRSRAIVTLAGVGATVWFVFFLFSGARDASRITEENAVLVRSTPQSEPLPRDGFGRAGGGAVWFLPVRNVSDESVLLDESSAARLGGNIDFNAFSDIADGLTILNVSGPGCVFATYLIFINGGRPEVSWTVDGEVASRLSGRDLDEGTGPWTEAPFFARQNVQSGVMSLVPVCFSQCLSVVVRRDDLTIERRLDAARCAAVGVKCPIRVYAQFTGQRYVPGSASARSLVPFDGHPVLAAHRDAAALHTAEPGNLSAIWAAAGGPVHPARSRERLRGRVRLDATGDAAVFTPLASAANGPGVVTEVRIRVSATGRWDCGGLPVMSSLRLRVCFDNATPPCQIESSFGTLFGGFARRAGREEASPGLFAGRTRDGELYLGFPMPYFSSVAMFVAWRPPVWASSDAFARVYDLPYGVRNHTTCCVTVGATMLLASGADYPMRDTGYFSVQEALALPTSRGEYFRFFEAPAGTWGRIVGFRQVLMSPHAASGGVQEGDMILYADGLRSPVLHTTGFEDFFGAGHIFASMPNSHNLSAGFGRAFQGAPYHISPARWPTNDTLRSFNTTAEPLPARKRGHLVEAYRFAVAGYFPFADGMIGVAESGSATGNPRGGVNFVPLYLAYATFYYTGATKAAGRTGDGVRASQFGEGVLPRLRRPDAANAVYDPRRHRRGRAGSARLATLVRVRAGDDRSRHYDPAPGGTLALGGNGTFFGARQFEAASRFVNVTSRQWMVPPPRCTTILVRRPAADAGACRLLRVFNATLPNQAADVWLGPVRAGRWTHAISSPRFCLLEDQFLLPRCAGPFNISICPLQHWSEVELAVRCLR
jgi:hypothetical protein